MTFSKSLTTVIENHLQILCNLMVPMSPLFFLILRWNLKCLEGINYNVVPRFFLSSSSNCCISLIRCGLYSRAVFIGNFASILQRLIEGSVNSKAALN